MKQSLQSKFDPWTKMFLSILSMLFGLMFFASGVATAQGIRISGTVTEQEGGKGIIGATVQVKGTNRGTVTDFDGKYVIEVTGPESVLVFLYRF